MSFNHQYPYTDLSELNLDYIIRETKNTRDLVDENTILVNQANANATSAKETADSVAAQLNQAVGDAAEAKNTANQAKSIAETATTTANQANQTANTAQTDANQALSISADAQTKANEALSKIKKLYKHKLSFNVSNNYYPNITKSYIFLEVINNRAEAYTTTEIESGQIIMTCTGYFKGDWASEGNCWGSYAEFQTGNLRLWGMVIETSNLNINSTFFDVPLGQGYITNVTDTVTELQ